MQQSMTQFQDDQTAADTVPVADSEPQRVPTPIEESFSSPNS
jgi:hypothetical protein